MRRLELFKKSALHRPSVAHALVRAASRLISTLATFLPYSAREHREPQPSNLPPFRTSAALLATLLLAAVAQTAQQPSLIRENGKLVAMFYGSAPAAPRLHINSHGPVTVEGGVSGNFSYS